jgi:hypothetical protein
MLPISDKLSKDLIAARAIMTAMVADHDRLFLAEDAICAVLDNHDRGAGMTAEALARELTPLVAECRAIAARSGFDWTPPAPLPAGL